MAKFAPVVPPQLLRFFKDNGCLGDYHLLLAHDIINKPRLYADIFARPNWSNLEIILDNSVIETGNAVDIEVIVAAAMIVRPTTTVLPDVLLKSESTIESCKAALPVWAEAFDKQGLEPNFMIVPQGVKKESWIRCAEAFADDKHINYWGIPRNATKYFGTRQNLAEFLTAINPHRTIHMLGFSDDVFDDITTAKSRYVYGIDSAVPIRAISQGIPLTMNGLSEMPPRGNWWDKAVPEDKMIEAMMTARQWFAR